MDERKVRAYSSYSADALVPPAAGEGVAWLGRAPWAKASPSYRLLRFSMRSIGLTLSRTMESSFSTSFMRSAEMRAVTLPKIEK